MRVKEGGRGEKEEGGRGEKQRGEGGEKQRGEGVEIQGGWGGCEWVLTSHRVVLSMKAGNMLPAQQIMCVVGVVHGVVGSGHVWQGGGGGDLC